MKKNVYPIDEKQEESWARFSKIHEVTNAIIGQGFSVPVFSEDILICWVKTARFWSSSRCLMHGIDFMYEAIYYIRYRAFSKNVNTPDEMMLTVLIKEELCRCGYAFHVWCNMREFENAYSALLFHVRDDKDSRAFSPLCLTMYLAGYMANSIMLKDIRPFDWGDKLDCDYATYPYGPDYMRYRITEYENAVCLLIPEASGWNAEWVDGRYVAECIKKRYSMDFTNDEYGYDCLIGLVADRKYPRCCARFLYGLGNVDPALLDVLWGEKTCEMVLRCFLDIYARYRAARKNKFRSLYGRNEVMQSWLYKWAMVHRDDVDAKLSSKVRTALLNIGLNI